MEERKKDPIFDPAPTVDDYAGAANYLSLSFDDDAVRAAIAAMRASKTQLFRVNDIIRASGLGFLPNDDPSVQKVIGDIKDKVPLHPILLLRGTPLIIADGYHRCNAIYHRDPSTMVPCKLGVLA